MMFEWSKPITDSVKTILSSFTLTIQLIKLSENEGQDFIVYSIFRTLLSFDRCNRLLSCRQKNSDCCLQQSDRSLQNDCKLQNDCYNHFKLLLYIHVISYFRIIKTILPSMKLSYYCKIGLINFISPASGSSKQSSFL